MRISQREITGGVRGRFLSIGQKQQHRCAVTIQYLILATFTLLMACNWHTPQPPAPCHTDLERELLSIDREEKKLIKEIKDAARTGNEKGARLLAKSLVRLRGQRTKVLASSAQLRGVRASIGVRKPVCTAS